MSESRLHSEQLAAIPDIRHEFANSLEAAPRGLWRPRQVHGHAIAEPTPGSPPLEADGCVAGAGGPPIGVVTADCVPLLLARRDGARVGAIHAGWRGCALGIVEEALARVGVDAPASELVAALGPAASGGYEVGAEVMDALRPRPERTVPTRPGHALLDLRGHVADRLVAAGVPPSRVEIVGPCTLQSLEWPSYRREGQRAGRAVSWIAAKGRP